MSFDCLAIFLIDDLLSKFDFESNQLVKYKRTALFYHSDCLKHKEEDNSNATFHDHVERPERCSISYQMLQNYGLLQNMNQITPREATKKELKLTHSNNHVNIIIENDGKHGKYQYDTFFNKHSARAAKLAAGATIDLMNGILQNKFDNGFALIRPPGHHCEHNKAMGFCLFNNAVVAVNCIQTGGIDEKILIVDWDIHHGNGTQNLFYDNKNVLYFSVHRYDGFFYPGTGLIEESGDGFNINVPLNCLGDEGYGDREYLLVWKYLLLPICKEFNPKIILISAGYDACVGDPLGGMKLTPSCYGLLTRLLLNECSNIGLVLEGGYNLDTMPRAICCCVYALLKGAFKQKNDYNVDEFYTEFKQNISDGDMNKYEIFHKWYDDYSEELNISDNENESNYESCKETLKDVLKEQKKYWKCAETVLNTYYEEKDLNDSNSSDWDVNMDDNIVEKECLNVDEIYRERIRKIYKQMNKTEQLLSIFKQMEQHKGDRIWLDALYIKICNEYNSHC
eukprot:215860_1